MTEITLTEQEMVEILEDIARNGGSTARIQAIKYLREIADGKRPPEEGFDELDAARRKRTQAA